MDDEEIQYDIKVVNAFKSYGKKNVINGLHMNVPPGSIYGLLGASGCGKSTILQCILGKLTLDSGSVNLRADHLNDVGYMPQDLCLEDVLTIREVFEYYGTLYSMTKKQVESRIEYLTAFLEVPDLSRLVKNISGGQCRRVSLAVSILHDPKIIFLDEPTVGIDPLLRQRVWDEFVKMVEQSKKTIVITTHYIEEATKSNVVGFMRNGVLVDEGAPQIILAKYEADTLESAFLTLCCKQETNIIAPNDVHQREIVHVRNKNFTENGTSFDLIRIKALMKKNVKVFSRDYMLMMVILLIPIFQSFNLCFLIGVNINGMQIAVKSDEVNLINCGSFKIRECILDEASNQSISCVVINYLQSQNYKLKEVKDFDEGEYLVKHYKSSAFLHFPQNYSKDLSFYIGENRTEYDSGSSLYVSFSNENLIMKNQIVKDVTDSIKQVIETTSDSCSINPKVFGSPINFDVIQGKEVKSYQNTEAAVFVVLSGFYLTNTFAVTLMLTEKMDGLLSRSMFAGVTILELLISLFCIETILYIVQMITPLLIIYVCFSNPLIISGSLFIFFFTLLIVGWIGFLYGIIIAGIFSSKMGCVYAMNGLTISLFLLSGFVWPIEGQSSWLKSASELLPTSIAGRIMNDIALRGWTWDHPSVVYGTIVLILQLLLLVLFLVGLTKMKKNAWVINK